MPNESQASPLVLVTGATGYIGGRLVPRLLEKGFRVRALSRSLEKLQSRTWSNNPRLELVAGDVTHPEDLERVVKGCEAVYYLVHSMIAGQTDFEAADRHAAQNLVEVAEKADVQRLIYLGGLGTNDPDLSPHLRSRNEVAEILSGGKVPTTVFRAAMIIGSGSTSFEILRYLTERLPVMVTPRWLKTPSQPISVANVLEYLVRCLEVPETIGRSFDIGGPDIVSYKDLIRIYSRVAGYAKRLIIPVPVLTPQLSSYWIHFVTPVPAYITRPLIDGLKNPAVCKEQEITKLIPQKLYSCEEAIQRALDRIQVRYIESRWTDAGKVPPVEWYHSGDPRWAGGTIEEDRQQSVAKVPIEHLWKVISGIGGDRGWFYANQLWRIRGFIDRIIGGVGLRRGRRDPQQLLVGDAVDFWRVLDIEDQRKIVLVAEMKLPGEAILEFSLTPLNKQETEIKQCARFYPNGLLGILYWYSLVPFHFFIFRGMLRNIKQFAEQTFTGQP